MLNHGCWRQAGISLVELMVGLTVGLLVIAAATSIYIVVVRSGNEILASAKLNEELRAAMNLMVADIRRAGSWTHNSCLAEKLRPFTCIGEDANPFTVRGTCTHQTDLQILDSSTLQLTYNREDSDPTVAVDCGQHGDWKYGVLIGFRLNGGAIQMHQCVNDKDHPVVCDTAIRGTYWEGLTDINNVIVESLSFRIFPSCFNLTTGVPPVESLCLPPFSPGDRLIETRRVRIDLKGYLKSRPEFKMNLIQDVRVVNDRIIDG